MDAEKIAAAEAVLSEFPVWTRNVDGSERLVESKPAKMVALMDPSYYCQQYGLPERVRMFPLDMKAVLSENELDELYAYALAGEWPA